MTTTQHYLRPLDPDTFPPAMRSTVRWHLLMQEADDFTRATGFGLANVWHEIKSGNYDAAVRLLAEIRESLAEEGIG